MNDVEKWYRDLCNSVVAHARRLSRVLGKEQWVQLTEFSPRNNRVVRLCWLVDKQKCVVEATIPDSKGAAETAAELVRKAVDVWLSLASEMTDVDGAIASAKQVQCRFTRLGGHIHCRVFGPGPGKAGNLVFSVEEWPSFIRSTSDQWEFIDETAPPFGDS